MKSHSQCDYEYKLQNSLLAVTNKIRTEKCSKLISFIVRTEPYPLQNAFKSRNGTEEKNREELDSVGLVLKLHLLA